MTEVDQKLHHLRSFKVIKYSGHKKGHLTSFDVE